MTFSVTPIPVRSDNFAYLVVDGATRLAALVDPFDAPRSMAAAESHPGGGVSGIACFLTTHRHQDHAGGNSETLEMASAYNSGKGGIAPEKIAVHGGDESVSARFHCCLIT